jgi:hypothetical protein
MLLDVGLQTFETVGEIFDISPRPIGLCPLNLLADQGLVSEVGIVEVPVVPEEEGGEIQGQVGVFLLLRIDDRGYVHLSDYNLIGFEPCVYLRIVFEVFEEDFEGSGCRPGELVKADHRDEDGEE